MISAVQSNVMENVVGMHSATVFHQASSGMNVIDAHSQGS
jgi:hypothetical protein